MIFHFTYRTTIKASIILLPLLGLTWLFGLLAVNQQTSFLAWLFVILNASQVHYTHIHVDIFIFNYYNLMVTYTPWNVVLVVQSLEKWVYSTIEYFLFLIFINLFTQGIAIFILHVVRNERVRLNISVLNPPSFKTPSSALI